MLPLLDSSAGTWFSRTAWRCPTSRCPLRFVTHWSVAGYVVVAVRPNRRAVCPWLAKCYCEKIFFGFAFAELCAIASNKSCNKMQKVWLKMSFQRCKNKINSHLDQVLGHYVFPRPLDRSNVYPCLRTVSFFPRFQYFTELSTGSTFRALVIGWRFSRAYHWVHAFFPTSDWLIDLQLWLPLRGNHSSVTSWFSGNIRKPYWKNFFWVAIKRKYANFAELCD